jgi:hypothetical protein
LLFLEQSILQFTHSRNEPPASVSITTDHQRIEENDDHSTKVRARDSAHRFGLRRPRPRSSRGVSNDRRAIAEQVNGIEERRLWVTSKQDALVLSMSAFLWGAVLLDKAPARFTRGIWARRRAMDKIPSFG